MRKLPSGDPLQRIKAPSAQAAGVGIHRDGSIFQINQLPTLTHVYFIVLDCSTMSYVDVMGVKVLQQVCQCTLIVYALVKYLERFYVWESFDKVKKAGCLFVFFLHKKKKKLMLYLNIVSTERYTLGSAGFQFIHPIGIVVFLKGCKIQVSSSDDIFIWWEMLTIKSNFQVWEQGEVTWGQVWRVGWMRSHLKA